MGVFNGHHQTCEDPSPNSLMGAEKRAKEKIRGEMRQPKVYTLVRTACLLVLSPVMLMAVEGASLSLEHSREGQIAPRFYEQLEHRHYRPESHQQFNSEGSRNGNGNLMNLRGKFGQGVGREEEELFEADSVGGRDRNENNDDDENGEGDNGNDEILRIAASEVAAPRRLQAVELLMEKYKQLENVKDEVEEREKQEELEAEEEESATAKEPEVQFKSEHHLHQHQRQHHNHPPIIVPTEEGVEEDRPRTSDVGRGRGRALWSEDFDKKALELCGTSASLQCGKRVQSLIEGQQMTELSVHMKCDLRDDFLKCIDTQKRECLSSTVLPQLPPKDVIKVEQSKLWKILWTAGGCVLAD